jgi:galactose oxidase
MKRLTHIAFRMRHIHLPYRRAPLGVLSFAALAGLVAGACALPPQIGSHESPVINSGTVRLIVQHSGKCLQAANAPGQTNAVQMTCGTSASQQWSLKAVTGGYQIVSAANSSLCLNLPGATTNGGSSVALSTCSAAGVPGEIWNPTAVGNNYNLIATHDSQCMDVNGRSLVDGAQVIQWQCNGGTNQVWALDPVAAPADAGSGTDAGAPPPADAGAPPPPADAGALTPVQLVAQHSGKCIQSPASTGQAATQQTCNGGTAQKWALKTVAGGVQIVTAADPTLCLNLPGATTNGGTSVVVSTCSAAGVPGEIWSPRAVGANFNFVATHDSQCMDVNNASQSDGVPIIQWQCNNGMNQLWAAQAVAPPPPPADAGAGGSGGTDAGRTDAPPPPPDAGTASAPVQLVAQHSGKCIESGGTTGQVAATQQTCSGSAAQAWSLKPVTGGVQIVSAADPTRCLNLPGATSNGGTGVVVSSCSAAGAPGEIWNPSAVGANFNFIATHDSQCMDVNNASRNDGALIIQWQCNGGTNQLWAAQAVTPPPPPPPPADAGAGGSSGGQPDASAPPPADAGAASAPVQLVAQHSGKCVSAAGTSGQVTATQQTCDGSAGQQWSVKPVVGGVQIVSVGDPTRCLNLPGATSNGGTSVVVSSCSAAGVPGEIWNPSAVGTSFNLIATHDSQCMDVDGASRNDGASIIQWQCNGGTNQQWALQPVVAAPPPVDAGPPPPPPPVDAGSSGSGGSGGQTSDAGTGSFGAVHIIAQHSSQCLGIAWPAGANAAVTQNVCNASPNQTWSMRAVQGGYQIASAIDGTRCLAVPGGASSSPGAFTALTVCSPAGAPGDVWTTNAVGANYNLVQASTGLCLDVDSASQSPGAQALQWFCSGALNQTWALQPAAPGLDPSVGGVWGPIVGLPSIGLAAAVLPNGKVITWASWARDTFGGTQPNQTYTAMFDPQTLVATEFLVTSTQHDMFCPGTAMLPDGRLFVNGGGPIVANTSIYTFGTDQWAADSLMNETRWYNTSVTLPDGRVFTLGGNLRSGLDGTGEIWTPGLGWKMVPGAVMDPLLTTNPVNRSQEHPRLFVAPNGKIFVPGPTPNMQWYDLSGSGSITSAGRRGDDDFSQNDVTVLYDVGKLLKAGGNVNYDRDGAAQSPSSGNAYLIDINGGGLADVRKIAPLAHPRAFANGVVLPDGTVLVAGGLDNGKGFSDVGATLTPELFDPATETWRDLSPMHVPRPYHSVALLLPDGRVFESGGGLCGTGCVANHFDLQIYSPPYLFKGPRPQITAAPGTVGYGAAVTVQTSGTVTGFSWIRMASTTHTVNTDQRFLRAASTALGGGAFSVVAPANANLAPPGYYMLFALNGGVPGVAKILRLGP